ncbi:Putative NTF2-like domain superfamily protein [Septoria linicola]|uniref:NTF2-like domain superfamily protein n=1 Tax=Septoria linicola TaxID=215465 RepID=A0A9Q9EJB9_9PEZI|nr:putative NTF2-like domain superfamily protein [Septoria linicola]USW52860.1 Putative NTF2-like domain superfamily protein [Septoria linicola]
MSSIPEFAYGSDPPVPVKPQTPEQIADGVTLLRPLSRKGHGPGMIILAPNDDRATPLEIQDGIPSLRMKWAEEGYCVAEIRPNASSSAVKAAVKALEACNECEPKEKMGLICYDAGLWSQSASAIGALKDRIVVAALYAQASQHKKLSSQASVPTIYHLAGKSGTKARSTADSKIYEYATTETSAFPVPFYEDFHYATEAVSHSRNLAFFKPKMNGPYFDLELLWDEHTYYEFENRSVENTMATMVEEPYVNHVPTLTGGIGRKKLTNFYRDHFIFSNPDDTALELISRTVGIDRVVDEFIYKFTHDKTPDWLFPGVPPTYRYVQIPMMAVVNIRGDRLYHEHISWDQSSALRQIGVIPETLPLTVELPNTNGATCGTNGHVDGNGTAWTKHYEVTLPVAGTDTVAKMRDKNSVPSNAMFEYKAKEI